jgi:hypothetical protein
MDNNFKEEDEKYQRFLDLGEALSSKHVNVGEIGNENINNFIEGYRSGELIEEFHKMKEFNRGFHIHMLEMVMITARKKLNNMDKYNEIKIIVEELKLINKFSTGGEDEQ